MLLEDARIFKRVYEHIVDASHCVGDVCFDVVYTFSGLETFFRDDYGSEVKSLFRGIYRYNQEGQPEPIPINSYVSFRTVIIAHSHVWKRMLQHIYTHDKTEGPRMYGEIKDAVFLLEKDHKDPMGNQLFKKFMKEYFVLERMQSSSMHPNFGACENCFNELVSFGIRFHKIRKHKKFFKKSDPKMWDLFDN